MYPLLVTSSQVPVLVNPAPPSSTNHSWPGAASSLRNHTHSAPASSAARMPRLEPAAKPTLPALRTCRAPANGARYHMAEGEEAGAETTMV